MDSRSTKNLKQPVLVSPILRQVGALAFGVASVNTTSTSSNAASGSATGNPRNKIALQPGHSLMDWIRLGNSGRDLTGLGPKAGKLTITRQELSMHNSKTDAWLAIRAKVYNITEYIPFHPGGENELLKGAGKDATNLFEQIHPWVNYEQILQKCFVGKLVAINPDIDKEALFFGKVKQSPSIDEAIRTTKNDNQLETSSVIITAQNSATINKNNESNITEQSEQITTLPRFDWLQKLDYIIPIFYTKSYANPLVEIQYPQDEQNVLIIFTYDDVHFRNELTFFDNVRWPCNIIPNRETGKVEFIFRKSETGIWDNYGVLKQQGHVLNSSSLVQAKSTYTIKRKMKLNYNTFLLKLQRIDGGQIIIPVGKHVRVFGNIDGNEIARSYTPVPETLLDKLMLDTNIHDNICLMVKQYPNGKISRYITDKEIENTLEVSKPFGGFDMKLIQDRDTFLLLAAGTGITPIVSVIAFLLERRIKKCQFARLLFFNRTEKDILFRKQFEDLATNDSRFRFNNILSEPDGDWNGFKGHINAELVEDCLEEHLKDTGYTIKDIFTFICGPPKFNVATVEVLESMKIYKNQIHVFEG